MYVRSSWPATATIAVVVSSIAPLTTTTQVVMIPALLFAFTRGVFLELVKVDKGRDGGVRGVELDACV